MEFSIALRKLSRPTVQVESIIVLSFFQNLVYSVGRLTPTLPVRKELALWP